MKRIPHYDAVVIGGGFYGCEIALHLKKHLRSVLIVEKGSEIMKRASAINQARIHNGYHYPRSFVTAKRSHQNFHRFIADYEKCIDNSFIKIYGIARKNSKVNSRQFEIFCNQVGLPLRSVSDYLRNFFSPEYIEALYEVDEIAFDIDKMRHMVKDRLEKKHIEILHGLAVKKIEKDGDIVVSLENGAQINSTYCFNCSYTNINTILHNSHLPELPFKHELTEMALVKVHPTLKHIGVTIMDGPFFSIMPFPSRNLHTLSHVRYTPHGLWEKYGNDIPHKMKSRYSFMQKDAMRFMPTLSSCKYAESLYEIKTLLKDNEIDDGRPILLRKDYAGIKNLFIVMGGKIDNVYDILKALKIS